MVTRFGCLECVDEGNSYLLVELEGKGILERVCIREEEEKEVAVPLNSPLGGCANKP